MANWSDCEVSLQGTKENIAKATREIEANIEDGWLLPLDKMKQANPNLDLTVNLRAGYGGGELTTFETFDESIEISMSGRWTAPDLFFKDLVKKYNLSMTYTDAENGCDFFHIVEATEGEITRDAEYSYLSVESINQRGSEFMLEQYNYIVEDEDWENEHKETIQVFLDYGLTIEQIKEGLGEIA